MFFPICELYLNDNQLIAIPTEIGNLTKIRHIDISRNQLRSVPFELNNKYQTK